METASIFTEKDKDVEFAGGYIPRQLSEELNLLAVHLNTNRSEIIRKLIADRLEETDISKISASLAQRLVDSFRAHRKTAKIPIKFSEYCKQVRQTFAHKKVANDHVEMILIKAKDLYYANKSAENKQPSKTSRTN